MNGPSYAGFQPRGTKQPFTPRGGGNYSVKPGGYTPNHPRSAQPTQQPSHGTPYGAWQQFYVGRPVEWQDPSVQNPPIRGKHPVRPRPAPAQPRPTQPSVGGWPDPPQPPQKTWEQQRYEELLAQPGFASQPGNPKLTAHLEQQAKDIAARENRAREAARNRPDPNKQVGMESLWNKYRSMTPAEQRAAANNPADQENLRLLREWRSGGKMPDKVPTPDVYGGKPYDGGSGFTGGTYGGMPYDPGAAQPIGDPDMGMPYNPPQPDWNFGDDVARPPGTPSQPPNNDSGWRDGFEFAPPGSAVTQAYKYYVNEKTGQKISFSSGGQRPKSGSGWVAVGQSEYNKHPAYEVGSGHGMPRDPGGRRREWHEAGRPGFDGYGYAAVGRAADGTEFSSITEANAYNQWLASQNGGQYGGQSQYGNPYGGQSSYGGQFGGQQGNDPVSQLGQMYQQQMMAWQMPKQQLLQWGQQQSQVPWGPNYGNAPDSRPDPWSQQVTGQFGNSQQDMWNNIGGFIQSVNDQAMQKPVGVYQGQGNPGQQYGRVNYDIRDLIQQGNQRVQDGWRNPFAV